MFHHIVVIKNIITITLDDFLNAGLPSPPVVEGINVTATMQDAVAKGAKILTGGKRHALGGSFFEATILTDVTSDMIVTEDETFGPVAPLFKFETEEEVLAAANDTIYGLSGSVWTSNIGTGLRVAKGIKSGTVGINAHGMPDANSSFGGYKQSGWGREMGAESVAAYLETKTIMVHY